MGRKGRRNEECHEEGCEARRAEKKELDAVARKCFETEAFNALKVKPTDISGMAERMEAYGREIDTIDFSGM